MRLLRAIALGLVAACLAIPAFAQAQPGASAAKPFVLYVSPASRKFIESQGGDLKGRVNLWRDLVAARGSQYVIVTHPSQLAHVPPAAAIIMASAVVLPDEERRAIEQRVEAGEGLLATWMPGSLDASGAPAAPSFLEQAFRTSAKAAKPAGEKPFLITLGDTPLTYGLPAGSRLWVGNDRKFPTPYLASAGAGYLSDWGRANDDFGLLAFTTVGASRRALIGVPEITWDLKSAEYVKLANLALDWVEGKPVAYLRAWPWPARGAMTIGVDALWRYENVPRISGALAKAGMQASFHFLSSEAAAQAAPIRGIQQAGHALGAFGDSTDPFAGQSDFEQRTRVERMMRAFRAVDPAFVPGGLRAPQGATDAATEKAAAALDYLVDSGRVDSLVPILAPDRHLVLLSTATNLDSNATLDAVNAAFEGAAQKAQLLGGYAFVGIDVSAYEAGAPLETGLARYADTAKERAVWHASATDVARWWRAHEGLKVASRVEGGALLIDVEAAEAVPFPAVISIALPPGAKGSRIDAPASAGAVQQHPDGSGGIALVLNALPAGRHSLKVTFAP